MKPRVLCVDDEPQVLEGLRDTLRRSFDVSVATSGAEGLATLRGAPSEYAVVISDMRMPIMTGAAFLREARRIAPDATRVLLTGYTDIDSAITAVNESQLFRFLTKPCAPDELSSVCFAALAQHRLQAAERVLLEQTLRGSVQALADVLSLASPAAFGRAALVARHAASLARQAGLNDSWEIEVSATLAPIGAVTLPPAIAEKLYTGETLAGEEQAMVDRIPDVTRAILEKIPRLEGVIQILAHYAQPFSTNERQPIPVGARALRIALDYSALETSGLDAAVAIATLRGRTDIYDPDLLESFAQALGATSAEALVIHELAVTDLVPGMTLADDVRNNAGSLLMARGQSVTTHLIERLHNLGHGQVREPLLVSLATNPGDRE